MEVAPLACQDRDGTLRRFGLEEVQTLRVWCERASATSNSDARPSAGDDGEFFFSDGEASDEEEA